MKKILEIIKKILNINNFFTALASVLKSVANFFIGLGKKYFKPFWFSSKKDYIIAPYVYVFFGMIFFFACIILFLFLSYEAAFKGIKDAAVILPTIAGVIATLVAMNTFMIKVYNEGKTTTSDSSTTPQGDA